MRILVTGALGNLGKALVLSLKTAGYDTHQADIAEFDITNFSATSYAIKELNPELVIHPAAWTDVDGCAREPEKALAINGWGAGNVALAAAEIGAAIVHVSSNEVFDGTKTARAYFEHDSTNPVNTYGYSKSVGEQQVMQSNPRHYIVRTSWLFAHGGRNFLQVMINAAKANKALRVVTDEVSNPTYNDDLAGAITQLITTKRYGIYHFSNAGSVSRWGFARYILDRAGFEDTPIAKITQADWKRDSSPPPYAPLANLNGKQLGIEFRPWQEAVDAFLEKEGLSVHD